MLPATLVRRQYGTPLFLQPRPLRWWTVLAASVLASQSVVATRVGDSWGTNIHWTAEPVPGEAAQLAEAFKIVRMDFSWSRIESAYAGLEY